MSYYRAIIAPDDVALQYPHALMPERGAHAYCQYHSRAMRLQNTTDMPFRFWESSPALGYTRLDACGLDYYFVFSKLFRRQVTAYYIASWEAPCLMLGSHY